MSAMSCGWQNNCQSRPCNHLQNVGATTYKNILQFYAKKACKKQCKRIAASLFLEFLARNNVLYEKGQKRISDGALVAITLMIAESDPKEKDIMVNLVMNLLTM